MKKFILGFTVFCTFLFFSCVETESRNMPDIPDYGEIPSNEYTTSTECLKKTFGGNYTDEESLTPDESTPWSEQDLNDMNNFRFYKYHSSNLGKDIVIADELSSYSKGRYYHSFYTNYLFVKYSDIYEEQMKAFVKDDFPDVGVKCDFTWVLTSQLQGDSSASDFLERERRNLLGANVYFTIKVAENELADYEKRLKSIAYKLSKYCSKVESYSNYFHYAPYHFYRELGRIGFYFYLTAPSDSTFQKNYVLYKSSKTFKDLDAEEQQNSEQESAE